MLSVYTIPRKSLPLLKPLSPLLLESPSYLKFKTGEIARAKSTKKVLIPKKLKALSMKDDNGGPRVSWEASGSTPASFIKPEA